MALSNQVALHGSYSCSANFLHFHYELLFSVHLVLRKHLFRLCTLLFISIKYIVYMKWVNMTVVSPAVISTNELGSFIVILQLAKVLS